MIDNMNVLKYLILTIILFSSCNNRKEADLSKKGLPYIVDLEECMSTERAMKISDIADTVEYIELKTPEDIVISVAFDVIPIDDYWIIHSRDGVFKFTNKGEYLATFGRRGQGPSEYFGIFNVDVDHIKKEIVINAYEKLLFYDLDGNYLRMERKTGTMFSLGISNSILWISEMGTNADKFIGFAMNPQGDIIDSIPSPYYGKESQDGAAGLRIAMFYKAFYRYKDTLYMKGKELNDTIYQLSGTMRKPYAAFNMGKYKLPMEYEAWFNFEASRKHGANYWGIPLVAEDDRYLFLLTQRYAPVDGIPHEHNEDNFRYIIYDKEKREGFVAKGEDGTRFTDDILGGPAIWPFCSTTDDYYYMNVISLYKLSKKLKNGNYKLSPALAKQIAGFDDDTNPIVIRCRRKK